MTQYMLSPSLKIYIVSKLTIYVLYIEWRIPQILVFPSVVEFQCWLASLFHIRYTQIIT